VQVRIDNATVHVSFHNPIDVGELMATWQEINARLLALADRGDALEARLIDLMTAREAAPAAVEEAVVKLETNMADAEALADAASTP
jgi:hypothetical protein